MILTTEGLIEQLARFRSDKLALVGLVGSMSTSEQDALDRLREVIERLSVYLNEKRSENRGRLNSEDHLASDILCLAREIEPWLAQVVEGK